MAKTIASLLAEVDAGISTNGTNGVTGAVLNGVLKSIASNGGNYYLFPKADGVTTADIGKLMMNDGSGTAKVYELSPATTAQTGRWVITLVAWEHLTADAIILVQTVAGLYLPITRAQWRDGETPTTEEEELNLIKDYFEAQTDLANITTTVTGNELVFEEDTYQGTQILLKAFGGASSYIDTLSRPALPEAPTAYPLGKLIGIDGSNAIISSNPVETYTLDETMTVSNSLFNQNTDIDFDNPVDPANLIQGLIVVPAGDGKVKPIDMNDLSLDSTFFANYRQHILGIALTVSSGIVTVQNATVASLLGSLVVKVRTKDIELAA